MTIKHTNKNIKLKYKDSPNFSILKALMKCRNKRKARIVCQNKKSLKSRQYYKEEFKKNKK